MNDHKRILQAAASVSDASELEFQAAMLGVLSTKVDLTTWAEAANQALDCFRDRR